MGSWAGSSQGVVAACLWLDPPCLARGLGWVGVQLLWEPGRKETSVRVTGVLPRIFQVLLLLLWLQLLPGARAAVAFEVLLRKYLMRKVTVCGWKAVAKSQKSSCAQSWPCGTAGWRAGLRLRLLKGPGWACVCVYPFRTQAVLMSSCCSAGDIFRCLLIALTCRIVKMMNIGAFFFLISKTITGLKFLLLRVGRKIWPLLHSDCGVP